MDHPQAALMRRLYDEHAATLWRYALRLTGDRARAEDVVQETLLRAWQHPQVTDDHEKSADRSIVVCGSRVGLVCGRRDRGWKAASPSAV
jgi:RNA polymerase sigma-70 factor (ECF subfamily)